MKKKLAATLSVVLILGLAVLGILAYLTSEDSDVNVMTLGEVKIVQHEYERVQNADGSYEMVISPKYGEGYKLKEFTQAKPLYPATGAVTDYGAGVYFDQLGAGASGGHKVLAGLNNVQDKFVLVENTGKSDAYVRTIIAFEMGSLTEAAWDEIVMTNINEDAWKWNWIGATNIDGNNYYVAEAVYTGYDNGRHAGGILPAGEYTYSSLAQIYLKNEATNEDCVALDGNQNGTYDILVLSQAVQTAGFDNATAALTAGYGEANAANVIKWFSGMTPVELVSDAEDLADALTAGGSVVLNDDISLNEAIEVTEPVYLDLNGNTLSAAGLKFMTSAAIENGTIESAGNTNMVPHLSITGGTLTMDDVTVEIDDYLNYQAQGNRAYAEFTGVDVSNATVIFNDCDISVKNNTMRTWNYMYGITANNANVTMNGGSIVIESAGATITDLKTAVSGIGTSTITLNNVAVNAATYGTTMGHLVINTTDKSVTDADFVSYGGTHELNFID